MFSVCLFLSWNVVIFVYKSSQQRAKEVRDREEESEQKKISSVFFLSCYIICWVGTSDTNLQRHLWHDYFWFCVCVCPLLLALLVLPVHKSVSLQADTHSHTQTYRTIKIDTSWLIPWHYTPNKRLVVICTKEQKGALCASRERKSVNGCRTPQQHLTRSPVRWIFFFIYFFRFFFLLTVTWFICTE